MGDLLTRAVQLKLARWGRETSGEGEEGIRPSRCGFGIMVIPGFYCVKMWLKYKVFALSCVFHKGC